MKVYSDIIQRSQDWYIIKWGMIGGSSADGLLKNTDTLFYKILSEQSEEFEYCDNFINDTMQRGIDLEPEAREYLEQYYNVKFNEVGWVESDTPLLGISPDGLSDCLTKACEIKCLGRKEHTRTIDKNTIPLDHISQCIHYFTVIDTLQELYFIAYRPESIKHYHCILTRDSIVNIGTDKKPVMVTISDVVEMNIKAAHELDKRIKNRIDELKKI